MSQDSQTVVKRFTDLRRTDGTPITPFDSDAELRAAMVEMTEADIDLHRSVVEYKAALDRRQDCIRRRDAAHEKYLALVRDRGESTAVQRPNPDDELCAFCHVPRRDHRGMSTMFEPSGRYKK